MFKTITLNFYDSKNDCSLPSDFQSFLNKTIELFEIEERLKNSLFFETFQNDKYIQIEENNYQLICPNIKNNQEILVYVNKEELNCVKQLNNDNIEKDAVINIILKKQKEKIKNKNISILKENNSIGFELENNIRKIIKEKYAILKEEIIKEKNINVNNIINESKIVDKFMENFKNNEKNKYKNISHEGAACSSCGDYPIKGKRFKCCICPSYDLCEDCERTKGMIHSHPMYILKKEIINDD
jgi:hypothetical protein